MLSQRALQLSARRLALRHPALALRTLSPAAIATGQIRSAATAAPHGTTTVVSQEQAIEILAQQRLARPVSPHLGIYQPQITWYASALNRITGCILSGGLYIFGFSYLVAPLFGWHLETASMAAAVAAWPIAAKLSAKFLLAFPFTFHSFNGIRHLIWDTGAAFTNKQVIVTGWTVIGLSVLSALGLVLY